MLINEKPVPKRTAKEKEESWRKLCERRVTEAEAVYKAGLTSVGILMAMEIDGGKCQKCGVTWKKVSFDNAYGAGTYYRPACSCYYSCNRCGKQLYLDDASGKLADGDNFRNPYCCTNCGHPLNGMAEDKILGKITNEFSQRLMKKYFDTYRRAGA